MRKVIAVIILIGLGALLWINPGIYNTRDNEKKADEELLFDSTIEEDEILRLAKANQGILNLQIQDLQTSPEELVDFNAMIMTVMYSVDVKNDKPSLRLSDDEIKLLAGIQREYYHEDLLKGNDEGLHLRGVVINVKKALEVEEWFVDYKINRTEYDVKDPDIATVLVTYIPNYSDGSAKYDIRTRYLLERENIDGEGLWFIKGWVGVSEDDVVQ